MKGKHNIDVGRLCELVETKTKHQRSFSFAPGYAEPGYSAPERGIVFGNWNPVCGFDKPKEEQRRDPVCKLGRVLEAAGFELEWSDEWATCDDCGQAVRTSADSYGWQKSFWKGEAELLCVECVKANPDAMLASLEGNYRSALTFDLDLEPHGFKELKGGFEHGFHSGQDASPKLIAKELKAAGVERFIFKLDSTGQFDFRFSVHVHTDCIERAVKADLSPEKTDGPSVSEGMKKALRDASIKSAQLKGNGCIVSHCDASTGTAEVLIVPQDKLEEHFKSRK